MSDLDIVNEGLTDPYQLNCNKDQCHITQEVTGSSPVPPTITLGSNRSQTFTSSILDNFISSRASGISPKTIILYHFALDRFIGYPITPEGINAYLKSLTCGTAKNNYYRCIKTLCSWLYQTEQIPTNPIERVLPPRRQKKLLPAISKEQLGILVNNALCERDKVVLNLLWYSGIRLSEAASVKSRDFNWEEGTLWSY